MPIDRTGYKKRKITIDEEQLAKLASFHCTYKEMGEFFGCSPEFLHNNFERVIKQAKSETRRKLRNAQLELAIDKKNATMLIWLRKQMLGQQDSKTVKVDGGTTNTIKIEFVGNSPKTLGDDSNSIIDVTPEILETVEDSKETVK